MHRTSAAIRLARGANVEIKVFATLPMAIVIELGRVRMPKADLPYALWGERRGPGDFNASWRLADERG